MQQSDLQRKILSVARGDAICIFILDKKEEKQQRTQEIGWGTLATQRIKNPVLCFGFIQREIFHLFPFIIVNR